MRTLPASDIDVLHQWVDDYDWTASSQPWPRSRANWGGNSPRLARFVRLMPS